MDRSFQSFKEYIVLFVMLPFVALPLFLAYFEGKAAGTGVFSPRASNNLSASSDSPRSNLHFIVVTHGQPSDPFWSVFKKGVDQGTKDMGVQVEYKAPDAFDMVAMAHLIDTAVASKPDGLVVTIPDADALRPSIQRAVAAGIPVISMNSGSDVAIHMGSLCH